MNGWDVWVALIDGVLGLAWPAAVALALWWYRDPIGARIHQVETVETPMVTVKFATEAITKVAKESAEAGAQVAYKKVECKPEGGAPPTPPLDVVKREAAEVGSDIAARFMQMNVEEILRPTREKIQAVALGNSRRVAVKQQKNTDTSAAAKKDP